MTVFALVLSITALYTYKVWLIPAVIFPLKYKHAGEHTKSVYSVTYFIHTVAHISVLVL